MNSEMWATIRRLSEVEKLSKSAIARRLNIHRWTVRRALASTQGVPVDKPRCMAAPGKLEAFKPYLQERLKAYPDLSQRKLFLEIRNQGYTGGRSIVRDYLITIRPPKSAESFLRLETLPGEFAQVDWANAGTITIGNAKRKLSCFVMVLSYSRMIYLEFMLSQRWENFVQAHINAFEFFGGVPQKINYDNLKTVVLTRVGREIRFHPRFMDFAGCYLFDPIPCGVRRANEKGKVESGIKYVRTAFLAGREMGLFADLQREAVEWRDHEANVRIHGTTHEKPIDRFEAEKMQLTPLPARDFDCSIIEAVPVTRQALINFEANRYSVPHGYAGKTLTLVAQLHEIEIYDDDQRVAVHTRCYEKYRVIENPAHYASLLAERKKANATKLVQYFLALTPECEVYLKGLVAAELHVASHLEKIQEMIHRYGRAEVMSALLHALKFNAFGADYIQRIIHQQRAGRQLQEPQPILLNKKPQWNKVSVEETDLSLYDKLFDEHDQ